MTPMTPFPDLLHFVPTPVTLVRTTHRMVYVHTSSREEGHNNMWRSGSVSSLSLGGEGFSPRTGHDAAGVQSYDSHRAPQVESDLVCHHQATNHFACATVVPASPHDTPVLLAGSNPRVRTKDWLLPLTPPSN